MKETKLTYVDLTKPAEIYSAGLQFSFASEDMEQCHGWVLCKDFLHDVIFGVINKCDVGIYGFYWKTNMPKPDMKNMRMLIRDRNMAQHVGQFEMDKTIAGLQEFMNKVEKRLNFEPCIVEEVKGMLNSGKQCKDRVFMITGDKKWMHAPPLISLFTLYVRAGLFHKPGESYDATIRRIKKKEQKSQSNDSSYLNSSRRFRLAILEHNIGVFLEKMEDNYNVNKLGLGGGSVAQCVGSIHNNLGIVNGVSVKAWSDKIPPKKAKEKKE